VNDDMKLFPFILLVWSQLSIAYGATPQKMKFLDLKCRGEVDHDCELWAVHGGKRKMVSKFEGMQGCNSHHLDRIIDLDGDGVDEAIVVDKPTCGALINLCSFTIVSLRKNGEFMEFHETFDGRNELSYKKKGSRTLIVNQANAYKTEVFSFAGSKIKKVTQRAKPQPVPKKAFIAQKFQGKWSYSFGFCRPYHFEISADSISFGSPDYGKGQFIAIESEISSAGLTQDESFQGIPTRTVIKTSYPGKIKTLHLAFNSDGDLVFGLSKSKNAASFETSCLMSK